MLLSRVVNETYDAETRPTLRSDETRRLKQRLETFKP